MNVNDLKVTIHVHVSEEASESIEQAPDSATHLHIFLDSEKLAQMLLRSLAKQVRQATMLNPKGV